MQDLIISNTYVFKVSTIGRVNSFTIQKLGIKLQIGPKSLLVIGIQSEVNEPYLLIVPVRTRMLFGLHTWLIGYVEMSLKSLDNMLT